MERRQSQGSWTWKKVEDLNDYEASQLAINTISQHTGGADRGQDIRPDDHTRAAEARFAAETRTDQTVVNSEQGAAEENTGNAHLQDDAGEVMPSGKPQQQRSKKSAESLLRQTELTREALEWCQPGPSNTVTTNGLPQTAPAPNPGTR